MSSCCCKCPTWSTLPLIFHSSNNVFLSPIDFTIESCVYRLFLEYLRNSRIKFTKISCNKFLLSNVSELIYSHLPGFSSIHIVSLYLDNIFWEYLHSVFQLLCFRDLFSIFFKILEILFFEGLSLFPVIVLNDKESRSENYCYNSKLFHVLADIYYYDRIFMN